MKNWKCGIGAMLLMVLVFAFTFSYFAAVEEASAAPCMCTFWCPYEGSFVGGSWHYPPGMPKYCWSDDLNPNCACYPSK